MVTGAYGIRRSSGCVSVPHYHALALIYGGCRLFIDAGCGARASRHHGDASSCRQPPAALRRAAGPSPSLEAAPLPDRRGGPGAHHISCGVSSHDPAAPWNNDIKLLQSRVPGERAGFEHHRQLWELVGLQILVFM